MNIQIDSSIDAAEYERREHQFVSLVCTTNEIWRNHYDGRIRDIRLLIAQEVSLIAELNGEEQGVDVLQAIGGAQTSLKQLRGELANVQGLRGTVNKSQQVFRQMFADFWRVPRVCDVWMDRTRLVYRTLPLFGRDHGEVWRRMGPYEISLDVAEPEIASCSWRNLEGTKVVDGFDHKLHGPPNIFGTDITEVEGRVSCAGNLADRIFEAAAERRDYLTMVKFTVRYPECPGNEYNKNMEEFDVAPIDTVPEWYRAQFPE